MDTTNNLIPTPTKGSEVLSPKLSSATLSLKRALQKHIKTILNALPSLEAGEKDGEKHVLALSNYLEQRECVGRVEEMAIETIPRFPDLKSRLMLKISTEVEKEIESLTNSLIPLKGINQAMHRARADILSLASSPNAQDVDPVTMYEGSATVPPLTTMMDSLEAVEKEARELYLSRMCYLEHISDSRTVTSENICDLWMEDATKLSSAIKDCREIMKYFLEEKLS